MGKNLSNLVCQNGVKMKKNLSNGVCQKGAREIILIDLRNVQ